MINDGPCAVFNGAAPLFAGRGIGQSVLQRAFCGANTLAANAQTRIVHHREHGPHTVVRFADQPPFGTVILHHGCWAAVQTHFVFKRDNVQCVRHTRIAVFIRDIFRYDEQRNAFGPRNPIRQTCKNQMAHVAREIIITP